jgi:hypothetical protein
VYRLFHSDGGMPLEERKRAEELVLAPDLPRESVGFTTYFFNDIPPILATGPPRRWQAAVLRLRHTEGHHTM